MKYVCRHAVAILLLFTLAARGEEGDVLRGTAQAPFAAVMPESAIAALSKSLDGVEALESATEQRRVCKHVMREAETLLNRYPDSPERFRVLGVVFDVRKLLFERRQSEEYRDALLETAGQLVAAPDAYAALRVEPDMLLLQIALAQGERSPEEIALAIARFADRYRGTPAEAQSLMMAASSAFDLGNRDLLSAFRRTLSTHFSADPLVNAFMRERFGSGGELSLRGEFRRADGKSIAFPIGQTHLACFWSLDAPLLKERIGEITAMQARYKGQFKVFSFNLDELPDSGAGDLKRMDLDWIPMRLPGGLHSPVYQAVGGANMFSALVVGPHGLAGKGQTGARAGSLDRTFEDVVRFPRQAALLRSLCIGDFLVTDTPVAGNVGPLAGELSAIQACFPPPPQRYLLTPEAEQQQYETADALCRAAIARHATSEALWQIHNHRSIALLGLWRLSGDRAYLDRAVASAEAALRMKLPAGAGTIPQFAMATKALMDEDADTAEILSRFIRAAGGESAPASAYAAALMLSLDAHSRDQYLRYRDILLSTYIEDPSAWRVTSFLLEPSCASRLFERALPAEGRWVGAGQGARRQFKVEWHGLNGSMRGVATTNDAIHAVVFMAPTGDQNAAALQKRVVDHLIRTTADRPLQDMDVTVVFHGSDTNQVAGLMKRSRWSCRAGYLPDAEWSTAARQIGLVSADLRPNVFLTRPDGSILLALSGVSPDTENPDTLNQRLDTALRAHTLALAEKALAAKDYGEYAARLATSFPLKNRRGSRHEPEGLATSMHRRKLVWAYMQAEDWQRALATADDAIAALAGTHDPKRDPKVTWCRTCHGYLFDMCVRIALLRESGAQKEADEALALIDFPTCPQGKGVDALWEEVARSIKARRERFSHLQDPKLYLAEHERNMRAGCQNLYGFGIESDLMMRATLHEKLGHREAAEADRRQAVVRAWPFAVREYDPGLLHDACAERRAQARRHLAAEAWTSALDLVNSNIEIHEAEALRCNSMCSICAAQVQSFGFHARVLEELGRAQDAEVSRAMAEDAKCPPGKELESFKSFPINRMYGGGAGINRLNFIEGVMRGQNYGNAQYRAYRLELAADLIIRAQALEPLGQVAGADVARKRAIALAYPVGPNALSDSDDLPARYEDILSVVDDE